MAGTAAPSCCPATTVAEVDLLKGRGADLDLVEIGGQCYAHVRRLPAPVPPWDKTAYDILIAIALASGAGLDAFYLELPYRHHGGNHPRVGGAVITYDSRSWQLVSWHYPEGRPWVFGRDDLDSHITHCKGFFFHRGAINAIS
jgi:hypothetical protein